MCACCHEIQFLIATEICYQKITTRTKQDQTRQARLGKTRQDQARLGKIRQDQARLGKTRQDLARQGNTSQEKARQVSTRQYQAKLGKTRQDQTRLGITFLYAFLRYFFPFLEHKQKKLSLLDHCGLRSDITKLCDFNFKQPQPLKYKPFFCFHSSSTTRKHPYF